VCVCDWTSDLRGVHPLELRPRLLASLDDPAATARLEASLRLRIAHRTVPPAQEGQALAPRRGRPATVDWRRGADLRRGAA